MEVRSHSSSADVDLADKWNFLPHVKSLHAVQLTPAIEEYAQKKVAHAIQAYQAVVSGVDVKLSARGGESSKGGKCASCNVLLS